MINEYAYETTTPWDAPVVRPLTHRRLRMVPDGLLADGSSTGKERLCPRWPDLGLELAESSHGAAFSGRCHGRSAGGLDLDRREPVLEQHLGDLVEAETLLAELEGDLHDGMISRVP